MKRLSFLLEKALLAVALYGMYFMWQLASSPQLYADDWYARGGLRRTVQIVATDVLGPSGILLAALIGLLLYIGPRRIIDVCQRVLESPVARSSRRIVVPVAIVAGLAAFAQPAIRRPSGAKTAKPNVLLVVVDSFRGDRLDALVTPNLSRLAAKGTRFDRAYTSTPHPPSSMKTILTGQSRLDVPVPVPVPVPDLVSPETLPEQFAKAGYAIATITDESAKALPDPARAVANLEEAIHSAGKRPFFATASFATPRFPCASPPPYYARFADHAYRGRFKYDARRAASATLDEADRRQVQALSDGAIAAVDDALGRIWASLESHALTERTIVVVTGTDASTHVPLLVIDGRATSTGSRDTSVVRDIDLAPTLYELAQVAAPPNLDGVSLVNALKGEALEPRLAFAEDDSIEPRVMRKRMVRDERFKLVYAPTRASPQHLLFDTLLDPAEQHDVGAVHPAELARLRDELWSWMLGDPAMEKRDGYLLPKEPAPPFTSVLWITVDGLRSATPTINALARRGVHFTEAYASPSEFEAAADPRTMSRLLERKSIPSTFASYSADQATITKVDQQIDQLLKRADEKTVVVLAGSNATTRVPVVVVAPGVLAQNQSVPSRVRTMDLAPTVLDLLGIEKPLEMRGASLLSLARGVPEPERVIVSEGKGARAILHGPWRFVVRSHRPSQLFHLADDPTEAHDLAASRPDIVAEMKARFDAALANVSVTSAESTVAPVAHLRLRFAGAGSSRRVAGVIHVGDAKRSANTYEVHAIDLGPETLRDERGTLDVAFRTSPGHVVGFDIVVDPPATPITWDLWLDDGPWPDEGVFAGPFGLVASELRHGLTTDDARAKAHAEAFPSVDPHHEHGLFVTRALK